MEYSVRCAKWEDLRRIEEIYAFARNFMAEHGNETQWGQAYPPLDMLIEDINQGKLYVIQGERQVRGVFYFAVEADPTYGVIYQGEWGRDIPYGVIHRIAGDGSGGILKTAVEFARRHSDYLRIDTHEDNYVMQRALERLGFQRCGVIVIEDGTPRLAYDGVEESNDN